MTQTQLYNLIQHEQVCLATWIKGEDMSIMPENWSIESQKDYLDGLYKDYYQMCVQTN